MMKRLRLPVAFSILALVGLAALLHLTHVSADEEGSNGANGASYVTTVNDLQGNLASRGVITLHGDHTMSVIDSGQGGPAFFFSSQLGSWNSDGKGGAVGKTIDFDFPPNADVARLDYTLKFGSGGTITGTITLTIFPLQGNPLDGGGTVVGTFTFVGQLIQP